MPNWINRSESPFAANFFETAEGRMHYVDVGAGPVILMVHGTPTWSFLYRRLITALSNDYRVVAPDHLGFGLSDKPTEAPYTPADHARRLAALISELGLSDLTLMVHDFGGPIGLAHALEQPDNVARLVLFNTWLWSVQKNKTAQQASRLFGSPLGKFLYTRLNFSPRFLLKMAYGNKGKLTSDIHRHYTRVFSTAAERMAPWTLARELIGSSDWYDGLWQRREAIAAKPALLLWGLKDPTFSPEDLARWQTVFTQAQVQTYPAAGHFVPEEVDTVAEPIRQFMADSNPLRLPYLREP
ncbi:MAG TPA: alpha/beta fold hydrolase [Anaerolineae bacterium]|nr:alpha/beta fold hydrolase [Anaerolineae bacterium]